MLAIKPPLPQLGSVQPGAYRHPKEKLLSLAKHSSLLGSQGLDNTRKGKQMNSEHETSIAAYCLINCILPTHFNDI